MSLSIVLIRGRQFLSQPSIVVATLALACLGCAVFLGFLGWAWLGALAMVLLIGVATPLLTVAGARAELVPLAARAREGEQVRCRVVIRRRFPGLSRGLEIEWEDESHEIPADGVVLLTAKRRGLFPHRAVRIKSSFPIGLYVARRDVAVRQPALIWPTEIEVPVASRRLVSNAHPSRDAQFASAGDTSGVREYRRGDHARQIHWLASARLDRLIARERLEPVAGVATIVIDVGSFDAESSFTDSAFEFAVRVVAGMIRSWTDVNLRVRLDAGATINIDDRRGVSAAMDALAMLSPAGGRSSTPAHLTRSATVFLTANQSVRGDARGGVLRFTPGRFREAGDARTAGLIETLPELSEAVRSLGERQVSRAS